MADEDKKPDDQDAAAQAAAAAAAEGAPPEAPAEDEKPPEPPVIWKKVVDDGHAGAHGGAWKIALADMMTAMMAFFLLMWLLGATPEDQRAGVAEYFQETDLKVSGMGETAGSNGMFGGRSIIDPEAFPYAARQTGLLERLTPRSEGGPNPDTDPGPENENPAPDPDKLTPEQKKQIAAQADAENFQKLEKEIKQKLSENKRLEQIKDQVAISRDKDGLRIEIIDKADFAMFPSGSNSMQGKAATLIKEVASSLAQMPNKVAIRGHTDSVPFQSAEGRNNWSLSAERAEATRQLLEKNGIPASRFTRIEGVADTDPFNAKDPKDPRNRRMSITVLNQDPN